jgi:membrane-anchored glycerophosphoryl diester phosphodiesterase (GDPDase)
MAVRSLVMSGLFSGGVAAGLMPLVTLIVLLGAPAAYFMTAWAVVAPAVVIDRAGVFGAFSRSWVLTRRNRWAIFVLGIVLWTFAAILLLLSVNLAYATGSVSRLDPSSSVSIAWLVSTTLGAVVGSAGVASVYYELRILKEGADPSRLAEVFD